MSTKHFVLILAVFILVGVAIVTFGSGNESGGDNVTEVVIVTPTLTPKPTEIPVPIADHQSVRADEIMDRYKDAAGRSYYTPFWEDIDFRLASGNPIFTDDLDAVVLLQNSGKVLAASWGIFTKGPKDGSWYEYDAWGSDISPPETFNMVLDGDTVLIEASNKTFRIRLMQPFMVEPYGEYDRYSIYIVRMNGKLQDTTISFAEGRRRITKVKILPQEQ